MVKKRILLNWSYKRKDLLLPFLTLKDDFDFIFLFHKGTDDSLIKGIFRKIDWEDYSTPYHILKYVNPGKVIFHDIESFYQFSLNLAARNEGIPTYVLEHGFKTAIAIDEIIKHDWSIRHGKMPLNVLSRKTAVTKHNKSKTLLFYFRSIAFKNVPKLLHILCFAYYRKFHPLTYALVHCKITTRLADWYINFTYANSSFIRERDGVPEHKLRFIGNPFLDYFFPG